MIKFKSVKTIELQDWDALVVGTYGRPYSFQQQNGCQERGTFHFSVPAEDYDEEMHDEIPEIINGDIMGVKFEKWLERDPKKPFGPEPEYLSSLWWDRNFYPDFQTVANDLHKRGLIEAGDYAINIDW